MDTKSTRLPMAGGGYGLHFNLINALFTLKLHCNAHKRKRTRRGELAYTFTCGYAHTPTPTRTHASTPKPAAGGCHVMYCNVLRTDCE